MRFFKKHTCVKDVSRYYPYFLDGKLGLKEQERFFNCIGGFLDAVVNKRIVFHTPSRDHFTRGEMFRLFHEILGYEREKANRLIDQILFLKKILVGGSIDKLRDQELSWLLRMTLDYRDAYHIIRRQIPVLKRLFKGKPISENQEKTASEQLRKTLLYLERAYKREKVFYTIEDISQYADYMGEADPKTQSLFLFLQNLLEGVVFPQKEIRGGNWLVFVHSIRRSFDLLFYYNRYLNKELNEIQLAYNSLSALDVFTNLLSSNEKLFLKKGFPLKNLDKMLKASLSILKPSSRASSQGLFSHFQDPVKLSFITRILTCFSLNRSGQKECSSNWETADSSLVSFSFPDSRFRFFEDRIIKENKAFKNYFIDSQKIRNLKIAIHYYRRALLDINEGLTSSLATQKQMRHWLDIFFGWDKNKRIIFGSFKPSDNKSKMIHLLSYHSFLSLALAYHVPRDYFYFGEKELLFEDWLAIVSDLSPFFSVLLGVDGYKLSWRESAEDLFYTADLFLNSSDGNNALSAKELSDLFIHILSAAQQSQKVFSIVSDVCDSKRFLSCAVKTTIDHSQALSSYPRFKDHIFQVNKKKYQANMEKVLSGVKKTGNSFQFLELFFLIQLMEVNYYQRINTNVSFNLESSEILVFADQIKDKVRQNIPYLYNSDQALSYVMYAFKSGSIPFFTGSEFESIRFTHWHLNSKPHRSFISTPIRFHNLVFDFYHLYRRF